MEKQNVTFADFLKLDIRIGEIKKCEIVENSNKLLRLQVDLGEELGSVTILTGLSKYYQPVDFEGKKFLFLINLAPKKMANEISSGMLFVANINDKPTIFPIDNSLPNGSFLY